MVVFILCVFHRKPQDQEPMNVTGSSIITQTQRSWNRLLASSFVTFLKSSTVPLSCCCGHFGPRYISKINSYL